MKQNSHYKALLSEFVRTRKDCGTLLPRIEDPTQKMSAATDFKLNDDMGPIMQAWGLCKEARGKVRQGQGVKLRSFVKRATLQVVDGVAEQIEQGSFAREKLMDLKELLEVTGDMSFNLPRGDYFGSFISR
eukprot:8550905-Pyramimonas_sp.AAC.1